MVHNPSPGTGLIVDALAALGEDRQGVIGIQPVRGFEDEAIAGPAVTARFVKKTGSAPGKSVLDVLHDMPEGSIVCMQAAAGHCFTGDIQAMAFKASGAAGLIVDGGVRDIRDLRGVGLPVWAQHTATRLARSAYQLEGVNLPITMGGVPVEPGDLVHADEDGVVVVPHTLEASVEDLVADLRAAEEDMSEVAVDAGRVGELKEMYAQKSRRKYV